MFFGLGGLIYVVVLLVNAIAILSEDRFLARSEGRAGGQHPERHMARNKERAAGGKEETAMPVRQRIREPTALSSRHETPSGSLYDRSRTSSLAAGICPVPRSIVVCCLFVPRLFFGSNCRFYELDSAGTVANRFLSVQVGWGSTTQSPSFGGAPDQSDVKVRIIALIASVRTLMRIPLIVANTLIIAYELVLG